MLGWERPRGDYADSTLLAVSITDHHAFYRREDGTKATGQASIAEYLPRLHLTGVYFRAR
jgi:hypothetical protein